MATGPGSYVFGNNCLRLPSSGAFQQSVSRINRNHRPQSYGTYHYSYCDVVEILVREWNFSSNFSSYKSFGKADLCVPGLDTSCNIVFSVPVTSNLQALWHYPGLYFLSSLVPLTAFSIARQTLSQIFCPCRRSVMKNPPPTYCPLNAQSDTGTETGAHHLR